MSKNSGSLKSSINEMDWEIDCCKNKQNYKIRDAAATEKRNS